MTFACFFGHEFYLDDLHRFDEQIVVGICHKCRKPFLADCGLHLPGQLIGRKPLPCETCQGTGKKPLGG